MFRTSGYISGTWNQTHHSSNSALLEALTHELDLAIVASTGPPTDTAISVGRYALEFYGLAERFEALKHVVEEAELSDYPIVQSYADAQSTDARFKRRAVVRARSVFVVRA